MGNDMPDDPRIERLVPDPHQAAKQWYAREGLIPINHVFVVHERISRERPDVVREIYRMLKEARDLAPEGSTATTPPLGLEANRKGLQMAIDWSFEQKIIPRKFSVDELFDETSRALG
jgi:4,5-dihydroxyphthalate decarboxylase